MSFKTVGQLKTDILRNISPAKTSDSSDENGAIVQGVEDMLSLIKPKELSRRVTVENALYDQVNQYNCPDDLDTNKIMQWYRLKGLKNTDEYFSPMTQVSNRNFDRWNKYRNSDNLFTVEYQSSKKFIKVSQMHDNGNDTGLTIHDMNSLTSNGTWNVFGNVVDLATDNLTFITGSGSLRFDINTSSSTGGVETIGMESVNLTDFLNVGKVFTWISLPNLNQIQTITLELESAPGDSYSITVDSPHNTDSFQEGFNLLGFEMDRDTMNTNGTPNPADINKIRMTFVTNGTLVMNSIRLDNIVARKGKVYGFQYISNMLFKDALTGLMKFRPTLDSDLIITEYDTYDVLRAHCAVTFGDELISSSTDREKLESQKMKAINIYKNRHKEEFIDETQVMRAFGVYYGRYNNDGNGNRYNHEQDI